MTPKRKLTLINASLGTLQNKIFYFSYNFFDNNKIFIFYYLGISFMAVSADTGELMGASLNCIVGRDNEIKNYGDDNNDKSSKFNDIMVFLDKAGRDINVFGQFPNIDRIMELKIIAVHEAYRGQGVCKALIDKSKYIKHNLFIIITLIAGQLILDKYYRYFSY